MAWWDGPHIPAGYERAGEAARENLIEVLRSGIVRQLGPGADLQALLHYGGAVDEYWVGVLPELEDNLQALLGARWHAEDSPELDEIGGVDCWDGGWPGVDIVRVVLKWRTLPIDGEYISAIEPGRDIELYASGHVLGLLEQHPLVLNALDDE